MADIPFPSTGAPALRALADAGYAHLGQLDGVRMADILALHGMGPKGIGALRRAMAEHGWVSPTTTRRSAPSEGVACR